MLNFEAKTTPNNLYLGSEVTDCVKTWQASAHGSQECVVKVSSSYEEPFKRETADELTQLVTTTTITTIIITITTTTATTITIITIYNDVIRFVFLPHPPAAKKIH